jgi:hypothetical protein
LAVGDVGGCGTRMFSSTETLPDSDALLYLSWPVMATSPGFTSETSFHISFRRPVVRPTTEAEVASWLIAPMSSGASGVAAVMAALMASMPTLVCGHGAGGLVVGGGGGDDGPSGAWERRSRSR